MRSLFLVTWSRQVGPLLSSARPDEWQVEAAFVWAKNEEEACARELCLANGAPIEGQRHDLTARLVDDSGGGGDGPLVFSIATYFDN